MNETFLFKSTLSWTGGRTGRAESDDCPPIGLSIPADLGGVEHLWTSQDLMVASVESCLMMTFLALTERENLEVVSYSSRSLGTVSRLPTGYAFIKIEVYPEVEVRGPAAGRAFELMRRANDRSLTRRSLSFPVEVYPQIREVHP